MKYLFIYKTTNLINGKIYVGRHQTDKLDDGYIGCGITKQKEAILDAYFHRAVRKYGYENFKREILEDNISTFEVLKQREIFWITRLDARNPLVGYNILKGGEGGWDHWNGTEKHREMCRVGGKKSLELKLRVGENPIIVHQRNLSEEIKFKQFKKFQLNSNLEKTKEKRSRTFIRIGHQQGKKNSQFGTHWYINIITGERKKFKEGEQLENWILSIEFQRMKVA